MSPRGKTAMKSVIDPPRVRYTGHKIEVTGFKTPDPMHGVVIGHWVVTNQCDAVKQSGNVRWCLSKCGVTVRYREWEVAYGKLPATCPACRPGGRIVPPHRVTTERHINGIQFLWGKLYVSSHIDVRSNLKGNHPAVKEWDEDALPVLSTALERTKFGVKFGWKVFVRNCHYQPSKKDLTDSVYVKAVRDNVNSMELVVHANGGEYSYEVDLTTPRKDVPFKDLHAAVLHATSDAKPVAVVVTSEAGVTAAVTANQVSSNGHVGPIDVAKLLRLGKNIETLLTVGKDINELAAMKDAARKKVETLNAAKGDLHVKNVEAEEAARAAVIKYRATEERVAQCETSLRNAIAARDNSLAEKTKYAEAYQEVQPRYAAAAASADTAEKELRELELMEADRLKSVGDAKGLATLLEALSKIGG